MGIRPSYDIRAHTSSYDCHTTWGSDHMTWYVT
jgi:hypothetical protein